MSENDNHSSDGSNNPSAGNEDVKKGSKTFTNEELGQKLASERSRLREQFDKEKQDAIDEAVQKALAEQERKAKLSEDQRAAEAQKERQEKLDAREREITLRERKAEATEALASKNIPTAFAKYVLDEDADKMAENITELGKVFSEELEKAVKAAASSDTPKEKATGTGTGKTAATSSNVFKGHNVVAF